jgi:hypothetical protein
LIHAVSHTQWKKAIDNGKDRRLFLYGGTY